MLFSSGSLNSLKPGKRVEKGTALHALHYSCPTCRATPCHAGAHPRTDPRAVHGQQRLPSIGSAGGWWLHLVPRAEGIWTANPHQNRPREVLESCFSLLCFAHLCFSENTLAQRKKQQPNTPSPQQDIPSGTKIYWPYNQQYLWLTQMAALIHSVVNQGQTPIRPTSLKHFWVCIFSFLFLFLIQRRVTKVLQVQVILSLYKGDNDQSQQSQEKKLKPILLSQSYLACQRRMGGGRGGKSFAQVPGYSGHGKPLLDT